MNVVDARARSERTKNEARENIAENERLAEAPEQEGGEQSDREHHGDVAKDEHGFVHAMDAKAACRLVLLVRTSSTAVSMPSRRSLETRVVRAIPKRAAAPNFPPTMPFVSFRAWRMWSRVASS